MIKPPSGIPLDEADKAALRAVQDNGRLSNVQLAKKIHLSPPATHARMKRLEQGGYIRKYTAIVDREKAGYDLLCFINVSLQMHQVEQVEKFHKFVRQMPEVLECHHITGEHDYLLKVALRNRQDMQRFIVDRLTPVAGVARIHTSLALNEIKSTTALPLE